MDGVGGVRAESFDFYEGIRIVVPGSLATALVVASFATLEFAPGIAIASNPFALLGLVLVLGLTLYFLDIPYKSVIYESYRPTELLAEWYGTEHRRVVSLYLHILDTDVPSLIRSRALYMGSIFRIGFEAILLLAVAQFAWRNYDALWLSDSSSSPRVSDFALVGLTIVLVGRLLISAVRPYGTREKERPRLTWGWNGVLGALRQTVLGLGPFQGTGVSLAVACVLGLLPERTWTTRVITVLVSDFLAVAWLNAFLRGTRDRAGYGYSKLDETPRSDESEESWRADAPEGARQGDASEVRKAGPIRVPVDSLTQVVLFSLATGGLMSVSSMRSAHGFDQTAESLGWISAALLAAILIAGRGHERRLRGAYTSQRVWLELNRSTVEAEYVLDRAKEAGFSTATTDPKETIGPSPPNLRRAGRRWWRGRPKRH